MATGEEHAAAAAAAVEETPEKKDPGTTELPAPTGWKKKVRLLDLSSVVTYLPRFPRVLLRSPFASAWAPGCDGCVWSGSEGSGPDLWLNSPAHESLGLTRRVLGFPRSAEIGVLVFARRLFAVGP
jgi:hypothetical protein